MNPKPPGPYICPYCGTLMARLDRRRKRPLVPLNGSFLEEPGPREAPRLKCGHCGKVMILVTGSLS